MSLEALFQEVDALQREVNRLRPLAPKNIADLKRYFRIGLTYSSNGLEGNSLTESETKVILEEGITVAGKPLKDHFEAVGHAEALEKLFDLYRQTKLTEKLVRDLHRIFYHRIDQEHAGVYRKVPAFFSGSKYPLPRPHRIPALMKGLIRKNATFRKKLHPVHLAAVLHKDFVFIHPFIDGNGRVARLLMNLVLLQEGYLPAVIAPILRASYIGHLEAAHEKDEAFICFIAEAVRETQKDYLRIFK